MKKHKKKMKKIEKNEKKEKKLEVGSWKSENGVVTVVDDLKHCCKPVDKIQLESEGPNHI